MKRRNGQIDFEDEDSDEEDYDAKRRRQRMAKKRRIDGDSLEKLGRCSRTCVLTMSLLRCSEQSRDSGLRGGVPRRNGG